MYYQMKVWQNAVGMSRMEEDLSQAGSMLVSIWYYSFLFSIMSRIISPGRSAIPGFD